MTAGAILKELEALGDAKIKEMLMRNHGVQEPCFGVRIGDMKPLQKRIKKDYRLALDLFKTGNYDAMYFAGLIADDAQMTERDLRRWVETAYSGLCGSTVPWVAAGGAHGWGLGLEWTGSAVEHIAAAGWATLSCVVALKDDGDLDLPEIKRLVTRVKKEIHQAPDAVRYAMNNFVISVGGYVKPLHEFALATAEAIGKVEADLGKNSCKVPEAAEYIRKMAARGMIGKKRKTVKC